MLRKHGNALRSLPLSGIYQTRDRLIAPSRPHHSPEPSPDVSHEEEEEEVPPLLPPIFPPLAPEEPRETPPPPSPNTLPPSEKDDTRKGKKKELPTNKKEEEAKKSLNEPRNRCAKSLRPFMDKNLTNEEWHRFCDLVQALPEDLKQVMNRCGQRRGNPTRN